MPGYVSSFHREPRNKSEILFDRLKRNLSAASQSKEDKRPVVQEANSISLWIPNSHCYSSTSSSSRDVDGKDTTQLSEEVANTDIQLLPAVKSHYKSGIPVLKKVYSKDAEPVIELFEDPIDSDGKTSNCWPYNGQKTPFTRRKPKQLNVTVLTNETNGQKRVSPSSLLDQRKETEKALHPAFEAKTKAFPVKSFYSGAIEVLPIACSKTAVENEKTSSIPKLVNLDQSKQVVLDHCQSGPSVITRSRSFSSQPHQPYEIGLKNFGNTCYVNATLQVLFALPRFTDDLIRAFGRVENVPFFANCFAEIVAARKTGFLNIVNTCTQNFIDSLWMLHPSYFVREQQDANEFLVRLIEVLKSALPAGPANPIESHFQCEMIEEYHCAKCGKKRKNVQENTSICLPFSDTSSDLEQCLEAYMAEEERDLACNNCQAASMKTSSKFRSLPSKLIMSVNRFSKDAKLAKHIVPPAVLDVRRFMENPKEALASEYKLVAQIVHVGETKNFGHYVSHVYCEDGQWRIYNDMSIQTVSLADEIQSVDGDPAYVYFYIQHWPKTVRKTPN